MPRDQGIGDLVSNQSTRQLSVRRSTFRTSPVDFTDGVEPLGSRQTLRVIGQPDIDATPTPPHSYAVRDQQANGHQREGCDPFDMDMTGQ